MAPKIAHNIDQKLFKDGDWSKIRDSLFYYFLKEWISVGDNEIAKQKLSTVLFKHFISEFGARSTKNNVFDVGVVFGFERNLSLTLVSIAKRFYRDHLNHSIRVLLLVNRLFNKYYSISDPQSKIIHSLFGSALFHDIGYYLTNFESSIMSLTKALAKFYTLANMPNYDINIINPIKFLKYGSQLSKVLPEISDISNLCNQKDRLILEHNIVSSIEANNILNWTGEKSQWLQTAIARHDGSYKCYIEDQINNQINPAGLISLILILGDELQDWGRDFWLRGYYNSLRIESIDIVCRGITAKYHPCDLDIPILSSIYKKLLNLVRIRPHKVPKISFQFPISNIAYFTISELIDNVKKVLKLEFGDYKRPGAANFLERYKLTNIITVLNNEIPSDICKRLRKLLIILGGRFDQGFLIINMRSNSNNIGIKAIEINWKSRQNSWTLDIYFEGHSEISLENPEKLKKEFRDSPISRDILIETLTFFNMAFNNFNNIQWFNLFRNEPKLEVLTIKRSLEPTYLDGSDQPPLLGPVAS